eukprot:7783225-Karenia_brevis.AAC.1
MHRGLVLNDSRWADLIMTSDTSTRKVMELRSTNCKVLSPGDTFHVLVPGGKHLGRLVLLDYGVVTFGGTIEIPMDS